MCVNVICTRKNTTASSVGIRTQGNIALLVRCRQLFKWHKKKPKFFMLDQYRWVIKHNDIQIARLVVPIDLRRNKWVIIFLYIEYLWRITICRPSRFINSMYIYHNELCTRKAANLRSFTFSTFSKIGGFLGPFYCWHCAARHGTATPPWTALSPSTAVI